jgi:hypothetical protein
MKRISSVVASLFMVAAPVAFGVGTDDAERPLIIAQSNSQVGDIRQEDRQADRREDRQEDRRQDDAAQARVTLPRTATGEIDSAALLADLDAQFAAGVKEIQVRNADLTQQEVQSQLLDTSPDANLLRRIGDAINALPDAQGEFTVRLRGTVDARVQRKPDGSLRARIEDVDFGSLTQAERAQLAEALTETTGFSRVRLQGLDQNGQRVRVEFRTDKGLTANVVQGSGNLARGNRDDRRDGTSGRGGSDDRSDRSDRSGAGTEDRGASNSGSGRSGRSESVDRVDGNRGRPDKVERASKPERPEKVEKIEKPERAEKVERPERPEKAEKVEKVERPEKPGDGGRGGSGRR